MWLRILLQRLSVITRIPKPCRERQGFCRERPRRFSFFLQGQLSTATIASRRGSRLPGVARLYRNARTLYNIFSCWHSNAIGDSPSGVWMRFSRRSGLLYLSAFILLLELGCGNEYRPVANPIIGPGGQPQALHYAYVVNYNPSDCS